MRTRIASLGILAALATAAFAQGPDAPPPGGGAPPPPPPAGGRMRQRGVNGEVTAVKPGSITIRNRRGTDVVVSVSTTTAFEKRGATRASGPIKAAAADVKVGSRITVQGPRQDDGSVKADTITILPPSVAGTVTAVTDKTISVKDATGKVTALNIASTTTVQKDRQPAAATDLKVGDTVMVEYNGATATTIQSGQMGFQGGPGGGRGQGGGQGRQRRNRGQNGGAPDAGGAPPAPPAGGDPSGQ